MIFLVVDQVAGAEYVLPFLLEHGGDPGLSRRLFASPVSGRLLERHGIACEVMEAVEAERVAALFERHAPALCVLSATGNSALERGFLRAARARGVKTIQFIDNWVNYRLRFNLAGEELFPDRILTLDGKALEGMRAEGIPAEIITVVGQPYFEFTALRQPAPVPGERLLLLTQPVRRHYGVTLGYDETSFVAGAVTAAAAAGIAPAAIDIQVHPAEDEDGYRRLLASLETPGADAVRIVRGGSLDGAGTVLGMFSSVLVHAVLRGLAVASFQPATREPDKCFLSAAGYVPRLTTVEALTDFLSRPAPGAGSRELTDVVKGSCARFARLVLDSRDNPRFA